MLNEKLTRRAVVGALLATPWATAADEWISLFDGHSLDGWRPSENKGSWTVADGMLAANGPRSHLFYTGSVKGADFRNFELEVEVITKPECNSGIYFHTAYQEAGFPEKGFEIQINNTARGDGGYLERKKTGSLYGLRNMYKQLVPDEKPFRIRVAVRGKNVQIRLNEELLVDYVEPTPPVIPAGGEKQRFLDHGTFALQCHNDGSKAFFKSVRVRLLADDLPDYVGKPPVVDELYRQVIDIGRHNLPMVDYRVYLGDGMTLEDALRQSRADGIQYGIAAKANVFKSDAAAAQWLRPLIGKPVFTALSVKSGHLPSAISRETARQFDYIVGEADAKATDESLNGISKWLDRDPVDILSVRIPEGGWTEGGGRKLIDALHRNNVAIEINYLNPSEQFIRWAKDAGCKFAFGTGIRTPDNARFERGLQMVDICKLGWQDFFVPGAWQPKAVERRMKAG